MTKLVPCAWCGQHIDNDGQPARRGRPRRYCKRSCRQRDFEARHRARELGLAESDLVISRARVEKLDDLVYVLGCAIADVDHDLAEDGSPAQLRSALDWLLEAARPLVGQGEKLRARP